MPKMINRQQADQKMAEKSIMPVISVKLPT